MPTSSNRRWVFALVAAATCLGVTAACKDRVGGDSPSPRKSDAAVAQDAAVEDLDAAGSAQVRSSPDGGGRVAAAGCASDGVTSTSGADAGADGGSCAIDSDCDAGVDGRCYVHGTLTGEPAFNACAYRQCSDDSDCPGDQTVCGCGAAASGRNLCMTLSNCRTNADCPEGERCIRSTPSFTTEDGAYLDGIQNGAHGYFCTTPRDDCNTPMGSGPDGCVWDPKLDRWAKQSGP